LGNQISFQPWVFFPVTNLGIAWEEKGWGEPEWLERGNLPKKVLKEGIGRPRIMPPIPKASPKPNKGEE